ncbi:MAG: hypothetical protein NC132_02350 [Corallococcus sp.]|nr:hypothetical protein [Corallococcus sp.]MCM1358950.1 hypothetical protein [Corallococcus sp.]MCM1394939.1 hypothetical protein [Corallococcus sp.]
MTQIELRKNVIVSIILVTMFFATLAVGFAIVPSAFAAENKVYFSADRYTESDSVLLPDGTSNPDRNIKHFAQSVKNAGNNTSFPELAQVIPLEYLETTQTNAVFSHNGNEYGFYIAKEGERFDVLLVDFVYGFDGTHSDLEYRIQIKPLLQQSFERSVTDGGYEYKKCGGGYTYYVANPRFLTTLQNENALNYGDDGYTKYNDDGLIILQSRANYGRVGYATQGTLEFGAFRLVADFILDLSLPNHVGTVLHALENVANIFGERQEVVTQSNNEFNIDTNMSKTDQRQDGNLSGYTRLAGFLPQTEIVLSDDNDSYAELIVVLNDADYRSRLSQVCEFDIVRRNSAYGSMEQVNDDESPFVFSREITLFDSCSPAFTLDGVALDNANVPVYLLANGVQTVTFVPQYSGIYNFNCPAGVQLSLDKTDGKSFSLVKNRYYVFTLKNCVTHTVIGQLQCSLTQVDLAEPFDLDGGESAVVKVCPNENGYNSYQLSTSTAIKVLDGSFATVKQSDDGNVYCYFERGQAYYLLVTNNSEDCLTLTVQEIPPQNIAVVDDYQVFNNVLYFTNPYNETTQFKIISVSENGGSVSVYDVGNKSVASVLIYGNVKILTFTLGAGEKCYIVSACADGSTQISITLEPLRFLWKVDGQPVQSNRITLARHDEYDNADGYRIQLFLVDGDKQTELDAAYAVRSDDEYFTFSGGVLRISYSAPINYAIDIFPVNMPGYMLTITVGMGRRDYVYTVTLDTQNWENEIDSITLKYGYTSSQINVQKPIKKGSVFQGYFSEKSGKGVQYFDENMLIVSGTWTLEKNVTLYAYWYAVPYNVTFEITTDYGESIKTATAYYGLTMPECDFYPARKGYAFDGFYDMNGNPYYRMSIVNNKEAANVHGMDRYLCEKPTPCKKMDQTNDIKLYSKFILLECNYDIKNICQECGQFNSYTIYLRQNEYIALPGFSYTDHPMLYYDFIESQSAASGPNYRVDLERSPSDGLVYPRNRFFTVHQHGGNCIAAGTLITLADGRQVPVETLTGEESLLVWNLYTGQFDTAKILFIDKDSPREYKVINLSFSDGTTVKVISEHAFWDYDLNKYVYLRQNSYEYIGHWFNKQTTDENGVLQLSKVQLTGIETKEEYTTSYSPVTCGYLCYYVNGMLSLPGGIDGLFNIFEVNSDTMSINKDAMAIDVETYGLYTYEEFAEIWAVSEDAFNALNGKYLKIALGKGLIDLETISMLVARYAEFL